MTVDHVEAEEQRDSEPRLLDRASLNLAGVLGAPPVQHAADEALADIRERLVAPAGACR